MITTGKLRKAELETALRAARDMPVWLIPNNEGDIFERQWTKDLHLRRQQTRGSPETQPLAPDVGTFGDDSIFDDDSVGDELVSEAHSRGYEEDEGQVIHNDPAALLQSATAKSVSPGPFNIEISRAGQSSRAVSPTPTEPRASKPDASCRHMLQ